MVEFRFAARMLIAALGIAAAGAAPAIAQNQACAQITTILASIERNQNFRNLGGVMAQLQAQQAHVRQAEGIWINGGCQQAFNAGFPLSRECQSLAQTITMGRGQVEQLTAAAQEGQTLAQNREALQRDYARFNCRAGQSGVTIANQPDPRGTLLDTIFGAPEGYDYDFGEPRRVQQQTRRTVCVRTCDGYYWPISFSTTDDHIAQDAIRCHEMCPGTEVALFSYLNPGQEVEDMISLAGTPYRSMSYAFRYRSEVDMDCACQAREPMASVAISGASGDTRAVIAFGELSFPLPQPDPRAGVEAVVADLVHVPLPRPRPREDGTAPAAAQQAGVEGNDLRIVDFDGRPVRIVGPETPYVPEAAGGS